MPNLRIPCLPPKRRRDVRHGLVPVEGEARVLINATSSGSSRNGFVGLKIELEFGRLVEE